MNGFIDLHVHTTKSDGSDTPREVVQRAKRVGLSAIAITDHDTVDGIDDAVDEGKKLGVEVIPGIELSCIDSIHILCLNIDHKNKFLLETLDDIAYKRKLSYANTVENLNKLGVEITLDELIEVANSDIILRPHIEEALIRKGFSKEEAIHKLDIVRYKFGYKERRILGVREAINLGKTAGGAVILAHPGNIRESDMYKLQLMQALKYFRLDGAEVYYSDHDLTATRLFERAVKEFELLTSGGSDYHGSFKEGIELGIGRGNLSIPYDVLGALKRSPQWINRAI